MTEPKYGPWIIWNATPDSVCPVPEGAKGQRVRKWDAWAEVERRAPYCIADGQWSLTGDQAVVAYRILREPKVETVTGLGFFRKDGPYIIPSRQHGDTHSITFTLVDGEPPCGTYTGPDGHKINVERL